MALHKVFEVIDNLRNIIDEIETEVLDIDDSDEPINKKALDIIHSKLAPGAKNLARMQKEMGRVATKLRTRR